MLVSCSSETPSQRPAPTRQQTVISSTSKGVPRKDVFGALFTGHRCLFIRDGSKGMCTHTSTNQRSGGNTKNQSLCRPSCGHMQMANP